MALSSSSRLFTTVTLSVKSSLATLLNIETPASALAHLFPFPAFCCCCSLEHAVHSPFPILIYFVYCLLLPECSLSKIKDTAYFAHCPVSSTWNWAWHIVHSVSILLGESWIDQSLNLQFFTTPDPRCWPFISSHFCPGCCCFPPASAVSFPLTFLIPLNFNCVPQHHSV